MELNVAGWSALVGAGLVLGTIVWLLTPLPSWLTLLVGVLATWLTLLVLDTRRHRNSYTGLGREGLDAETGPVIETKLDALGITANYEEVSDEEDGETYVFRSIRCRHRDVAVVERVMNEELDRS